MKTKRILIAILVMIITIFLSNKVLAVEYYEIDYTDRSDIIEKVFNEWVEEFKGEKVPEEKRITDYKWRSFHTLESNPNKIKAMITFNVTAAFDNTTWKEENTCFIEMTNVDGEYQVDYIAEEPKGYDEFLERFEEYKKENPKTVQNTQIQGQETVNNLANQEIEKMSYGIIIVCSVVLAVIVFIIVRRVFFGTGQKNIS